MEKNMEMNSLGGIREPGAHLVLYDIDRQGDQVLISDPHMVLDGMGVDAMRLLALKVKHYIASGALANDLDNMTVDGVAITNCIMCGMPHPDNYPSTASEALAHNASTRANNNAKRRKMAKDIDARIKAKVKASGVDQVWIDKNLKSLHVEVE